MSNTITVYWTIDAKEWLRAKEPHPIYNTFALTDMAQDIGINMCPSFRQYLNNVYGVRSIYSYDFSILNDRVTSDKYGQQFFNEHMQVRSPQHKSFSFNSRILFFTEEDSLQMSTGIHPFLEDNEIAKRCMIIPGTLDIGKWFRQIDFAFYLRKEYNHFFIEENDVYQYIQFHTDKKIIFKQFYMDDYLVKQHRHVDDAKQHRPARFRKLDEYYSMFKNKDNIIKAIKQNLV
jgi:hypothetical protein